MNKEKISRLVGVALMSAIVVVLQLLGSFIKFGPVSISLVLIPIVVGAAMYGPGSGAVLGGVFGLVVLFQPDTAFFYGISVVGTILTVMTKGILCGWLSGLIYRGLSGKKEVLSVILAAIACPLVNTGVFFLGCRLFFWEAIAKLGGGNAFMYVLTVMIGVNFLAELAANILCSPVILRVIHAVKRR